MILPDTNVLLAAHRGELPDHSIARKWLANALVGNEAIALPDFVLMGVYRIATTPRLFDPPSEPGTVLDFIETVRSSPAAMPIRAGSKTWETFGQLAISRGIGGAAATDTMIAALCQEFGCTLFTYDRDFSKFPGLRLARPMI